MTRKEEAYFETELADYIIGDDETSDKEFFERIICANNVIARCLSRFKNDYDELDTKNTITEKETPVPPYYVACVTVGKTCASLGLFSTMEKAQTRIIEYENALNSSITHYDWEEFIHAYAHDETKIIDYDISSEFLDAN